MEKNEIQRAADAMLEVISAALIGVDVICIVQLVGLSSLDEPLTDALYCFAASIPLLAFFVLSMRIEKTRQCSINIWYKDFALFLGIIGTPIGVGCLILHLSKSAAEVFGGICLLALILVPVHAGIADERNRVSKK